MKVYKGTDKDMRGHGGFQYELGKTVEDDGAIRCGNKGFHSCTAPLDVLKYFPNINSNRYFEADADGEIDGTGSNDGKIASSKLTLKAEIVDGEKIKADTWYQLVDGEFQEVDNE